MNFSQFMAILRARRKIIWLTLLTASMVTLVISLVLPNSYKASAILVLNYKGVDPVTGMTVPAQLMPGYIPTQLDVISSKANTLLVIDKLKLTDSPEVKEDFAKRRKGNQDIRDWLAEILLKNLSVDPSRESSTISISFTGSDPVFSAAIANAFASAYLDTSIRLTDEPSQKAAIYFTSRLNELRTNLEQAQARLSEYQQKTGILMADPNLDINSSKIAQLTGQLALSEIQTADSQSRKMHQGSGDSMTDVLQNPLIQNYKAQIFQLEGKIQELGIGKNHPQYQTIQAEIASLKQKMDAEIQVILSGLSTSDKINKQKEHEIKTSITSQKRNALEENLQRSQLAVLQNEVNVAEKTYEAVAQRSTEANIEAQSNQSSAAILDPAVPPIKPHSPNLLLNMLLSVFMGTLLGVGFSYLAEMRDRRVRSAEDLVVFLQVPLLGMMERDAPKKRRSGFGRFFFSA